MDHTGDFVRFLITAKRNTYAGGGATSDPSRPSSVDLHYRDGEYLYIDSYLGGRDFIGEEVVWKGDVPLWGMNYYGKMLTEQIPEGFGEFLKAALRQAPEDAPYRGPSRFEQGRFIYVCSWQGNLNAFTGTEAIGIGSTTIYTLSFHGGALH
jgi:hypothetical protein